MSKNQLFTFLKRFDQFGSKVSVNYGKKPGFPTWPGTFFSIAKRIFLMVYLAHIATVLFMRRDAAITFTDVFREHEEPLNATDMGFDLAFSLMYDGANSKGVSIIDAAEAGIDASYFAVSVVNLENTPDTFTTGKLVPYHPCKDFENITGRQPFAGVSRTKFLDKLSKAQCLDMLNVTLRGDLLSGNGIQIQILKCVKTSDGPTCQYESTIDTAAEKTVILTFASQNFFSTDDYSDSPIKKVIGLADFTFLKNGKTKSSIVNVEYSTVDLSDSRIRFFDNAPEKTKAFSSVDLH